MRFTISSFSKQSEMLILCCSANLRSSPTCHIRAPRAHALPASQYTGWRRLATIYTHRGTSSRAQPLIITGSTCQGTGQRNLRPNKQTSKQEAAARRARRGGKTSPGR